MGQYSKQIETMLLKTLLQAYLKQQKGRICYYQTALDFIDVGILALLHERALTIKDLCDHLGLERADVARRINKYNLAGLITKADLANDRRKTRLSLTGEGEKGLAKAQSIVNHTLDFSVKDLTLNEEKAVLKYLSRLHQSIHALDDKK